MEQVAAQRVVIAQRGLRGQFPRARLEAEHLVVSAPTGQTSITLPDIGQIGVVLIVLPLLLMTDKIFTRGQRSPLLVQVCSAIIACFGAYWFFVRVAELG